MATLNNSIMDYIVIGLGTYGQVVATELTKQGHTVIAVDSNETLVDHIKDYVAAAYVLDATDEAAYAVLPIHKVNSVIITIGDNFGATIRIVALLKKNGVKSIFARAIDQIQRGILEAFELDCIMTPEEEAAHNFVQRFEFEGSVESYSVDKDHHVFSVRITDAYHDIPLSSIGIDDIDGLKLLDIRRIQEYNNLLGLRVHNKLIVPNLSPSTKLQTNDELICYGTPSAYKRLCNELKKG